MNKTDVAWAMFIAHTSVTTMDLEDAHVMVQLLHIFKGSRGSGPDPFFLGSPGNCPRSTRLATAALGVARHRSLRSSIESSSGTSPLGKWRRRTQSDDQLQRWR